MESEIFNEQLKTQLTQASQQVREGDFEHAISTLKRILEGYPRHEISLGMLASIYLQIGMQKQAVELYQALLAAYPANPLARFQLGMAELNRGNPELALEASE